MSFGVVTPAVVEDMLHVVCTLCCSVAEVFLKASVVSAGRPSVMSVIRQDHNTSHLPAYPMATCTGGVRSGADFSFSLSETILVCLMDCPQSASAVGQQDMGVGACEQRRGGQRPIGDRVSP